MTKEAFEKIAEGLYEALALVRSDHPPGFTVTEHGWAIARFIDRDGKPCSIQKSGLAREDTVWFGIDTVEGKPARMHLTQEMVANLLPALLLFVETGELPSEDGDP